MCNCIIYNYICGTSSRIAPILACFWGLGTGPVASFASRRMESVCYYINWAIYLCRKEENPEVIDLATVRPKTRLIKKSNINTPERYKQASSVNLG